MSKHFPGVQALDDVSLEIRPGEVHVLLGQNGAGKSTLMKVLYGAYQPDRGEILVEGRPVRIASPAVGRRLGIAVIFQEFSLVPYLDLAQNIFLGREPRGSLPGTIDHAAMHAEARPPPRVARHRSRHARSRPTRSGWRSSRWSRSPRRCRRTRASW